MSDAATPPLRSGRLRHGLSVTSAALSVAVAAASVLFVARFVQISSWSLPGAPDSVTLAVASLAVSVAAAIGCAVLNVAVRAAASPSDTPKRVADRATAASGVVTLACVGWVISLYA
jgi:hypothetical protein